MDCVVHVVRESQTQLSDFHMMKYTCNGYQKMIALKNKSAKCVQ